MIHLGYRAESKGHMQVTTNIEGRSALQCPVNYTSSDLYAKMDKRKKKKKTTKLLRNLQKFSLCRKGKFNVKTVSHC